MSRQDRRRPYDPGVPHPRRFEEADSFGATRGLPAAACLSIGGAVLDFAGDRPGIVLEIGAGRGEIGVHLATGPRPYLGLDSSRDMLARFARRGGPAALVECDASASWPVRAGGAALVFGSRVFHLLDGRHAGREAARALAPGGVLLVGRVRREPADPRERLRDLLRAALLRRGFESPDARESARRVVETLRTFGAEALPAATVCSWEAPRRPGSSLATWRSRAGLPGCPDVPPAAKEDILAEIEASWRTEFGDPDAPVDSREWFVVEGARLP